jgi:hypothetical protein
MPTIKFAKRKKEKKILKEMFTFEKNLKKTQASFGLWPSRGHEWAQLKHKLGTKLVFAPKLVQKPIWVPLFSFKIFVSLAMPKLGILVPTLIEFMDNFIVSFSFFMGGVEK